MRRFRTIFMRKRLTKEDIMVLIMIPTILILMVFAKDYLEKNAPTLETYKVQTVVVDSVAIKPPGNLHTMQTSTIYEYYIDGKRYQSHTKVKLGDTFKIHYIRKVK